MKEISERLWLHFLWTFALSDHMGDASEAVRGFATKAGLPQPPDDADLDEWLDWIREQGVEGGIHADDPPEPDR